MKRVAGYIGAFVAGTVLSGSVAFAGTKGIQALQKTITIAFTGQTVATGPALTYKGKTYILSDTISNVLSKYCQVNAKWSGNQFNWTAATPPAPKESIVGVSQLPYTYKSANGMQITFNSITADSSGTVLNVTFANNGKAVGQPGMNSVNSSIAAGGKRVAYQSLDDSIDITDLQPGQSVTGNMTFDALPTGVTQFTLYYDLWSGDFNEDKQHVTFDLTK